MKSCIVVTGFARTQPGYLDFAYRIKALTKQYTVTVISDHELTVPEMQIENVEHVVLPCSESTAGWLKYLWLAARYIRTARPDVVVLLHTMTAPLVYLLNGIPHALYWNEHALRVKGYGETNFLKKWYREWKYQTLFIKAARRADLVMPIGESHYEDLLQHGCASEKLRLIYMGVDDKFIGAALNGQHHGEINSLELVYTGSVEKARGRDVMLEGVAKAIRSGVPVRLTMVGASLDEIEYCNAYADKLGAQSAVRVLGRVPGERIPNYLAGADAGICIWEDRPWWRFNPPTKLFEYMVAGLPVLASNIRTHTQYVKNWDNGIIFEYDSDSLAAAIGELWSRRTEIAALRQRAFAGSRQYLWQTIEPQFLQTVDSLTGNSP
jgi:glycosyltransferase involved in cell wall biosynthesis